jgi:UPF0716 protein FxsA
VLAWLFLAFTIVPIVELYVLIQIGKAIGGLETIIGVILIGAAGAALAKKQGFAVLRAIQRSMSEGRMPGRELLEGALVLAGGLLLITPGVFTDVAGVLLLLPPIRRLVAGLLARRMAHQLQVQVVNLTTPRRPLHDTNAGPVIDVKPDDR